jgi:hypothetical protein
MNIARDDFTIQANIDIANQMWKEYQKMVFITKEEKQKNPELCQRKIEWNKKTVQEKIAFFQSRGYSDFISKYPIPTRYMFMHNEYKSDVFEKYLLRLKTVGFKGKDEWMDRQADYVKMLWRAYHPRGSLKEANAHWQHARESIKDEMTNFEQDSEAAKIKSKEKQDEIDKYHKENILAKFENDKEFASLIDNILTNQNEEKESKEEAQKEEIEEKDSKEESMRQAIAEAAKNVQKDEEPVSENWEDALSPNDLKRIKNREKRKKYKERKKTKALIAEAQKTIAQEDNINSTKKDTEKEAEREARRAERRKQIEKEKILKKEQDRERLRKLQERREAMIEANRLKRQNQKNVAEKIETPVYIENSDDDLIF